MSGVEDDDVALKLLHTADWHLGLRFPQFPPEEELQLTRARLDAVDRILDLAERWQVDAVLCAGDLFDGPHPDKEWWQGLAKRLERRRWNEGPGPGRPVFLLPGNHDPLTPDSVYGAKHAFRRALPDWVHVVDRDDYVCELGRDAVLYATPCRTRSGQDDLTARFPPREPGDKRLRVGMTHGQTFTFEGLQTSFPIPTDAAEKRGLDYLAIGDTHSFEDVTPDGPAPTIYPGAPEATKFSENGAGCVAIVFFPRRGRRPIIHQEKVGRWTWREESCRDLETLRHLKNEDLRQHVVRLRLEMSLSLNEHHEAKVILEELGGTAARHGRAGILLVDASGLELAAGGLDDFPADLPPALAWTVERLRELAEADGTDGTAPRPAAARRALSHLYKLVTEKER